jgi:L-arabinose isomerase
MEQGYGFAGEGDWKTAALVRAFKVMAQDAPGGTSFMEDYTYHFGNPSQVLGAHMLEICPSLSKNKPRCEIHPLGIGGKKDPVRLVFDGTDGTGINVSLIDLGTRFRFILNEVNAVPIENKLPNLPVARVLWTPQPSLEIAASAWMKAGGAHHTVYTQALDTEVIQDFATLAGVELICIDKNTKLYTFEQNLNANDTAY